MCLRSPAATNPVTGASLLAPIRPSGGVYDGHLWRAGSGRSAGLRSLSPTSAAYSPGLAMTCDEAAQLTPWGGEADTFGVLSVYGAPLASGVMDERVRAAPLRLLANTPAAAFALARAGEDVLVTRDGGSPVGLIALARDITRAPRLRPVGVESGAVVPPAIGRRVDRPRTLGWQSDAGTPAKSSPSSSSSPTGLALELDHARLRADQRGLVGVLQRSVLPVELPADAALPLVGDTVMPVHGGRATLADGFGLWADALPSRIEADAVGSRLDTAIRHPRGRGSGKYTKSVDFARAKPDRHRFL
jgi:hypothetical protein